MCSRSVGLLFLDEFESRWVIMMGAGLLQKNSFNLLRDMDVYRLFLYKYT